MFDLREHEVHIWFASPSEGDDAALTDAARRVLDAGEIARMERFHFPKDRRLFMASHLLVRAALTRYTRLPPEAWRFVRNDHGKPAIDPAMAAPPLNFSLAHTAGLAAVAVTAMPDLGVDLERTDRRVDAEGLIRRFFSPEEAAELKMVPPDLLRDRFFRHWTLKEAYLKALGRGLSLALDSFGFHLSEGRPCRIAFSGGEPPEAGERRFALIGPRPPYIAALSIACDPDREVALRCLQALPLGKVAPLACEPLGLSPGVSCPAG